jgi:hypothetical protein
MTSLAVTLSIDSRGPGGLYIITDSRITWGTSDKHWDAGQKTFASSRTPDVFGFCGDAYFPPAILRQVIDQVNAGLLLAGEITTIERHAIVSEAFKSAMALTVKVDVPPFAVFHGARDGHEMRSTFRLFHITYSKADGWGGGELDLNSDRSYLAHLDGSGKRVIEERRKDWLGTNAEGTSRAAIWAFCDALQSGKDPFSGAPPQLVGIWRKESAQTFGFLWHGKPYLSGLEVPKTANFAKTKWFNHRFERCDGATGRRLKDAQPQPKPPPEKSK